MAEALAGNKLYRAQVTGLVCPFCVCSVEQRLQAIEGVEYVDVSVEAGRVLIGVGSDAALDAGRVGRAVEKAGFRFDGMKSVPLAREELSDP